MHADDLESIQDAFIFTVQDTKPNVIYNNIFHITWSRLKFASPYYNVSELDKTLRIPILRIGTLNIDIKAKCEIKELNSWQDPFVNHISEIYFEENDERKNCLFSIKDDLKFQEKRSYQVKLITNNTLLALPSIANVDIYDNEDEPEIEFKETIFYVNETTSYFEAPVVRKGDTTKGITVMCTTSNITASGSSVHGMGTGSDYKSRHHMYNSFINFDAGINEIACNVKIIDDSFHEPEEEFELVLSNPHPYGKLGTYSSARIIIIGPNDVPKVYLKEKEEKVHSNDLSLNVIRMGVDLTHECTVWCGIQIPSLYNKYDFSSKLTFKSGQTLSECSLPNHQMKNNNLEKENVTFFLDSPDGCELGIPKMFTISLKDKNFYSIVDFAINHITIPENSGFVLIPILRTGYLHQNISVFCLTQDETAYSKIDFKGTFQNETLSLMDIKSGQKEAFCNITILDDTLFEGTELFKVKLLPIFQNNTPSAIIGKKNSVVIEINDKEDATTIELEKNEYAAQQHKFPNESLIVTIPILRKGDLSHISKIRVSTIDGSASSGVDYYAKSKILTFNRDITKKHFNIEILYNKHRKWPVFFTVILGPDEVTNAEISNNSRATISIPAIRSTDSLILPSVPLVISLFYFDNIKEGLKHKPKPGYPLICITPCDPNYPYFSSTGALCRESGIEPENLYYSWEIAIPLDEENLSTFEAISDSTLFTSTHHKVLDSIYFQRHEAVRCIVQPKDNKGELGIPLKSHIVKISTENGFCSTSTLTRKSLFNLQSQSFITSLSYVNSSDLVHPNKLHIHIEIPHEDGMLPVISTYPLHNIELLLTQKIYRQQHVCSNLFTNSTWKKNLSFLKTNNPNLKDVSTAFPYNGGQSLKETQILYQHLDLKKCTWTFDAWYSMSELVEFCGGTITTDFKARDTDESYITVHLPFFATYVFAAAPTGWTTMEYRTEMEFSFYYDAFLWKLGPHMDDLLSANLHVMRIGTNVAGHLFFEFKTEAKFYGLFLMEHHTLPGIKSHVIPPDNLDIQYNLELKWSEETYDAPTQFWRATSNYNLKDYSGYYTILLIPCKISGMKQFEHINEPKLLPCIAHTPQKFQLPLAFQQTHRPAPITYALSTVFQLFKDENLFLLNPFDKNINLHYVEYKGAYSKGENVYGKVFWNPEQELDSAYKLQINEVILCTGKDGYIPIFDPSGKHGKGPQYGCLLANNNLKHKFILLDRHNPDIITSFYQGINFEAKFIDDDLHFHDLSNIGGVDGFLFSVDPLYEIGSSEKWYLQVIYTIKPTKRKLRNRRSLKISNQIFEEDNENGTNIKMIPLTILMNNEAKSHELQKAQNFMESPFGLHHLMYLLSVILILLGFLFIFKYKPNKSKRKIFDFKKHSEFLSKSFNFYVLSPFSKSNTMGTQMYEVKHQHKIKQSEKCKLKVYIPKKKSHQINYITPTETEV